MPAVTLALPAANSHPGAAWTQHSAALQLSRPNCVPLVAGEVTPDAMPVPAAQLQQEGEERAGCVAPATAAASFASSFDSVARQTGPAIGAAGRAVVDLASPWKVRTLAPLYPVVIFDGQQVKIYGEGAVRSRYAYVALGAQLATGLQPLGIWIEHTVGASFWLTILEDLKARGLERIHIAVADDFVGLSAALRDVYPAATPQTCIAHLVRDSLDCAIPKDRKALAAALRPIYKASCDEVGAAELDDFERTPMGQKYPDDVASWRQLWDRVTPFFTFPPDVRRLVYATSAIEAVHEQLAKVIKAHGNLSSDAAATQLIWQALEDVVPQ
jgi:transposase-like protein